MRIRRSVQATVGSGWTNIVASAIPRNMRGFVTETMARQPNSGDVNLFIRDSYTRDQPSSTAVTAAKYDVGIPSGDSIHVAHERRHQFLGDVQGRSTISGVVVTLGMDLER